MYKIPKRKTIVVDQIKILLDRREKARMAQILRASGIKLSGKKEVPPPLEPKGLIEVKKLPTKTDRISEILREMPSLSEGKKCNRKVVEKSLWPGICKKKRIQ